MCIPRRPSAQRQLLLASRARSMRFGATESERLLWEAIRGGRLGVVFRRQVCIGGRYIADFAAAEVRLVVEVDGGYHRRRRGADARRDEELRRGGWRVLRVEAESVRREIGGVLERIRRALAAAPYLGGR